MAVVNHINPILNPNVKDSRWLTLEVCREHQRNKCTRTENECKFAHPPAHVEVQNGRVIACFDSIKGKCQRKDPPCKYLHPPQHLREQLLQNGRNNLILRSMQMQAYHPQMIAPSIIPVTPQYLTTVPTTAVAQFNPYGLPTVAAVQSGAAADGTIVTSQFPGVITTPVPTKAPARPDRLEVCREFQRGTCSRQPSDCRYAHPTENVSVESGENQVTVCMDYVKNKCTRDSCRYFHPPPHLQSQIKAAQSRANSAAASSGPAQAVPPYVIPPYKRLAVEGGGLGGKGGLPTVYQPAIPATAAAYQQATLMQLQQQPSYPLNYSSDMMSAAYTNYLPQVTGHPPTVPRF